MKSRAAVLIGLVLIGYQLPARLVAQDVTVSDPVWNSVEPPPDEMPKLKSRLRPDYPEELKKTSEIGYVIVRGVIDEKGVGIVRETWATHVPFQRAVEMELGDNRMTPARRGGRPIEAALRITAIFNPRSAATTGPEATPRLLAVAPVYTPSAPTAPEHPPVVHLVLSLDERGTITAVRAVDPVTEKNLAAIREALNSWRFAPARRANVPVAAEVAVPVWCERRPRAGAVETKPPRALKQKDAEYPPTMIRYGLDGTVKLGFWVDLEGNVKNPVVVSSNNPAFEEPAIKALRDWKFQPATRDGKPVEYRERIEFKFRLSDDRGRNAYVVERMRDQSKLPPELRYDTPVKLRGVCVPVYPYGLRRDEVTGEAKVAMLIDRLGRVVEVKVVSADRPEFGAALAAAVEGFQFDPALRDGQPVSHLLTFQQRFSFADLRDDPGDRLLRLEKNHPEKILSAKSLDTPLKPVSRRSPIFPVTVPVTTTKGSALVDCLVDEEGRVRLPRVVSATAEGFGYAAVQAAGAWWFEPPRVGGKPVVVRVQIPFDFVIPGPNAKAPTSAAAKQP